MNTIEAAAPQRSVKRSVVFAACLTFLLSIQLFIASHSIDAPGVILDEGTLLYYPELLTKGLIPQRDFESVYPPGNVWLLSAAYAVLGTSVQVERTIGLFYQMALVAGFFALLSRWNALAATTGGILCILALLPLNLVAYAWVGASAFALWSVVAISSSLRTELRAVTAGVAAGIALTYRLDLAPAIILSLTSYCLFAGWNRRSTFWLIGSATVALLPLLFHIALVSPGVFLDCVFVKPVLVSSRGRTLPLDYSGSHVGQLYSILLIAIGMGLLAGWRMHRSSSVKNPALLAAALLSLGALPQALTRADITHLSFVTPLALPLVAVATSILFSSHRLSPIAACLAAFALLPQSASLLRYRLTESPREVFRLHSGDRMFPVGNAVYAKASQAVIARMSELSKPGETLFIGPNDLRFAIGNDIFLYHMLPWLKPCSYYLEMNPLSANRAGSGLAEQIGDSEWLILNSMWRGMIEPNASQMPGSNEPNEVVRSSFDLVFSKPPFEIYRRHSTERQLSHSSIEATGVTHGTSEVIAQQSPLLPLR